MNLAPFLTFLLLLSSPLLAQQVEITKTDETRYVGLWQGFHNGNHHLDVRGTRITIPDQEVKHMQILSEVSAADHPVALPPTALPAYRELAAVDEALQQADFEKARNLLKGLQEQIRDLDHQTRLLQERLLRQSFLFWIQRRDLSELRRRLSEMNILPESDRRSLLSLLSLQVGELVQKEPTGDFTADLCAAVASSLPSETPLEEEQIRRLSAQFLQVAEGEFSRNHFATASTIYAGILRLQPERLASLEPHRTEATLAQARKLRQEEAFSDASNLLKDFLRRTPQQEEARSLLQEIEFALFQKEVRSSPAAQAGHLLREFLRTSPSQERDSWARQALEDLQRPPATTDIAEELLKYYPVHPGRWMEYRRTEQGTTDRIQVDSVRPEGDGLRVYYLLEEASEGFSAQKKIFHVDVHSNVVSRAMGKEQEILLKAPIGTGMFWESRSPDGRQLFRRSVLSKDAVVTVPAGTYPDCLIVESESSLRGDDKETSNVYRSCYAPGLGLIKLEYLHPDYRRYSLELTGYGGPDSK